ncbi:MAG: hypothetical protein WBD20_25305 [Pirellulaceae bacterium]
MYHSLLDRIAPVTRRFRACRFWWFVSLLAIVFAFLAYTAIDSARSGEINGHQTAIGFAVVAAIALLITTIANSLAFRSPRRTAERIERQFPSLNHRLLTALDQGKDAEQESLGYLQQRVIREARDHSRSYDWASTLSTSKLLCSRLSGIISLGALSFVLAMLWTAKPDAEEQRRLSIAQARMNQVNVEPGNTEVERGTSLAITARFADASFGDAQLICKNADGSERRISMKQNLADPIVGGFIASVDQKFAYHIETKDWSSETFTVDVFEFPSLVRSDAGLDFPEYTNLEDRIVEDTVRVSAVEGTKVKWLCYLNKVVASGKLVSKDGEEVDLVFDKDHPGALATEFDLTETKRFTLELVDADGRKNRYPPELIATVLPNNPPNLKLASRKDASVSPLEELPLGVEVVDDFGVAQVGLSYTFASKDAVDVVLQKNIARGNKEKIDHLIALEELNAQPDQLLAYHFWAEDIGPDGKVRRTESDMYFAEVRHFEEIYREGDPPPAGEQSPPQSQNGQEAEKLAELQKEIINATWTVIRTERGKEVSSEFTGNVKLLAESQADAMGQLEELSAELRDADSQAHAEMIRSQMELAIKRLQAAGENLTADSLPQALAAEQAAYAGLLKLRAREFQITRQQKQQSQSQSSASQQRRQKQLDDLELEQEENRYETQQQAQADSEQQQQERETRQVLNRLRELARRQEDLNKQLAELQSALEQAETKEEREEIERQLKRLRDQQQDLLRETDELSERMKSPENAENMTEESEQLDQTRENVRKATEALEKNDASAALTAGKRAEREFEEMRDEFRKKAAGEFNETVRQLRADAQELDQNQEKLSEQLKDIEDQPATPGLRSETDRSEIEESIRQQRQKLSGLLEQMQETVQEAEEAEPLLAEKLYESFRKTQQRQIDRKLNDTSELLRRGFSAEARELEKPAREGIEALKNDLEEAAESVLGDEAEALRRALGELDQLSRDLDGEIQQADPNAADQKRSEQDRGNQSSDAQPGENTGVKPKPGEDQPGENGERPSEQSGEPNESPGEPGQQPGQGKPGEQPNQGQPGQGQPGQGQPGQGQPGQGQPQDGEPQPGQGEPSESAGQESSQQASQRAGQQQQQGQQQGQRPGQQQGGQQQGGLSQFAADSQSAQPLTGEGFRDWSDRLRDVEEMVDDPELRSRAARIRDRAKDVRLEFKRHSKEPQWGLVEELIAQPLRELHRDVQEELIRRSAEKNALVPIDRDPVPEEFSEAVQKYYESLGTGK